jgi:hypothetical protein
MNIDQIEIVLLMDRSHEAKIDGSPIRVEGFPNSFAVAAHEDCILIGAISQQSQTKSDMNGGANLKIQHGTYLAPCSFIDVIELFGPNVSKLRVIDLNVADFRKENQFVIPRMGGKGFFVEAEVNLPGVDVRGLNGKHNDDLLTLIAVEAATGASQPKKDIN